MPENPKAAPRRRGAVWLTGFFALVAILAAALGTAFANVSSTPTNQGPSEPTSTTLSVTPDLWAGGTGGNVDCVTDLGYELSSARADYNESTGSFDAPFPAGVTVEVIDNTYVTWSSTFPIGAVIVKGGPGANVYTYDPQSTGPDTGLASPLNASGNPANLSNLTFCWNPVAAGDEGCTLGYWKVPVHWAAWAPTGYTLASELTDAFGTNALNDRFINALSYPGGPGVEGAKRILLKQAVAALLNASHPDVDYPLTASEVINQVTSALAGNRKAMLTLATTLDDYNNSGCPLGRPVEGV